MVVLMKRVAAVVVLGSGLGVSMGGCVAQSPVVGEEDGSVELVGSATQFGSSIYVANRGGLVEACLPRSLPLTGDGTPSCSVFSVLHGRGGDTCVCDSAGRVTAGAGRAFVQAQLRFNGQCGPGTDVDCEDLCICKELPATGESELDCLNNPIPAEHSVGWCYVDPAQGLGSEELVEGCPGTERTFVRVLRAGEAHVPLEVTYVLGCSGGPHVTGATDPGSGAVGSACLPGSEHDRDFNGYQLLEVGLEFGSPDCASNTCLLNNFHGRASCPYGQTAEQAANAPACFLPGSEEPVTVPVDPQLVERRARNHAICSCRCDGPDPSASYCACPAGMECAPMVRSVEVSGEDDYAGSYCIPRGTRYDAFHPPGAETCEASLSNCGDAHPF